MMSNTFEALAMCDAHPSMHEYMGLPERRAKSSKIQGFIISFPT